jgi:SAM-dependent methyltransferase
MDEFWESSFREKQEMWGSQPADVAVATAALFKQAGLHNILIPGFGYGRNAGVFISNGMKVTGIEISETAIDLAGKHFDNTVSIYHGSVGAMPFDEQVYDGIFCYALIHLLNEEERVKLIDDCFRQLAPGGCMVFVAVSKSDARYGEGKEAGKDTFETKHGIRLFFYDRDAVQSEFGSHGLTAAEEINEPTISQSNKPPQRFWKIICRKGTSVNDACGL